MTLIELVVVMGLLAALATYALTSLDSLSDRSRVDTTSHRIEQIRLAIAGDGLTTGRFVNDMGRLPKVRNTGEGMMLSELWIKPNSVVKYQEWEEGMKDGSGLYWEETFPGLPANVKLSVGWNGPYLCPSGNEFYDGFGNDFQIPNVDEPEIPPKNPEWNERVNLSGGEDIKGILSLGRDGDFGAVDWADEDQWVVFQEPRATLEVTVKVRDISVQPNAWVSSGGAITRSSVWSPQKTVIAGQRIVDTMFSHVFECTSKGTTGNTEPTWDISAIDATTTDDGVKWAYKGPIGNFEQYINKLRVALFFPNSDNDSHPIGWDLKRQPEDETFSGSFTLNDAKITCGIRKLYVYGYYDDGTHKFNGWSSGLQTIELKPGENFITVYLTESLTTN